ncbi:MAG: DUF5615 family PIN-like protein [Candidatus Hodarchaeales archaeon]
MRILLDNQLNGMKRYLSVKGFDVTTAFELGYSEKTDEDVIQYAKDHDMILVTEDNTAADLADVMDVDCVHLSMNMKSRIVTAELKKKSENDLN